MNNLSELVLENKKLIIRVDMNVPIVEGAIKDQTRILASIPTIKLSLDRGAKILLVSHLGRPSEGNPDVKFSLQPVVDSLKIILDEEVELVSELSDPLIFNSSASILLEINNSDARYINFIFFIRIFLSLNIYYFVGLSNI